MAAISLCAPGGDLVVAIGPGDAKRLARVSGSLLRIASPVFETMPGPSFKEGQTTHGLSNPLELPDDEPVPMINLFHVLHHHSDKVDTAASDWLQKLAVVCDKYGCAPKLSDFFYVRLSCTVIAEIDELIIWGMIGHEEKFWMYSDAVLRMPRAEAEASCHKDLLRLLPEGLLGDLQDYRIQARLRYSLVAHRFVIAMYTEVSIDKLCPGLMKLLARYFSALIANEIINIDPEVDGFLPDMDECVFGDFFGTILAQTHGRSCTVKLDNKNTTCHCDWNSYPAIEAARKTLDGHGVEGRCKWCLQCFQAGSFRILEKCEEHATASPDDNDDDDDDDDDNDEDEDEES